MTKNEDLAIEIYTRLISVRSALEAARKFALDAAPPAYLPNIQRALDHVTSCMLECQEANGTLYLVSGLIDGVTGYAAERNA